MTRRRQYTTLSAAAVLAVALAACDSSSTAPRASTVSDAQVSADVAATAGDAVAADVLGLLADEAVAGLAPGAVVGAALAAEAAGCPFDPATRYHVCSRVTERGLELTRRYQFRDAAGTPMQSYDPERTASIDFGRTADGNVSGTSSTGASWTAATHQAAARTVTGLAGAETQRVWNGSGTSADTATHADAGTTRHYTAATTHRARDVVVKLPRASYPWPQSGTITRTVNARLEVEGARGGSRQLTRTVTVTFNGTARVPLVVDGTSCTLDLEARRVSGCTR